MASGSDYDEDYAVLHTFDQGHGSRLEEHGQIVGNKVIGTPTGSTRKFVVEYSEYLDLNFGDTNGISLNLINPYVTTSGKTYYYLDASGDGLPDTLESATDFGTFDAVTHNVLDAIFNAGLYD